MRLAIVSVKSLKAAPKDGQPISLWTNENSAYLDVVTELRRLLQESASVATTLSADPSKKTTPTAEVRSNKYRIKREFDVIDRDEFRERTFAAIRDFFRRSVEEMNQIGGSIRARFENMGDNSFSCTVLNKAIQRGESHITIHGHPSSFRGDIIFSYGTRAPDNTANGFIRVEANEYELGLRVDHFSARKDGQSVSAEEAAKLLWDDLISRAGIDYA